MTISDKIRIYELSRDLNLENKISSLSSEVVLNYNNFEKIAEESNLFTNEINNPKIGFDEVVKQLKLRFQISSDYVTQNDIKNEEFSDLFNAEAGYKDPRGTILEISNEPIHNQLEAHFSKMKKLREKQTACHPLQ